MHRTTRQQARVAGEVYELIGRKIDERLAALDRYEGSEFQRIRVVVHLADGQRHRAWAYVLAAKPQWDAREIRSGIYKGIKKLTG